MKGHPIMTTTTKSESALSELEAQRAELKARIAVEAEALAAAKKAASIVALNSYNATRTAPDDAAEAALIALETAQPLDLSALYEAWTTKQETDLALMRGTSAANSHMDRLDPFASGQRRTDFSPNVYLSEATLPNFSDYLNGLAKRRMFAAAEAGEDHVLQLIQAAEASVEGN